MFRSRRAPRLAVVLASATLLLATACGGGSTSNDDSDASDTGTKASTSSGESAFPVSLDHKYGSTTIEAEPERIVTVGLTDQDAVLALGKVPVGTTEWLGGYKGAIGPWAADKLGSAAAPTVLKDTGTGPQVEKIAALQPDLILAVYGGLTKEQYESLSKFAPVVAQPKAYSDYGVPWQEQTETIGKALARRRRRPRRSPTPRRRSRPSPTSTPSSRAPRPSWPPRTRACSSTAARTSARAS